jgi:membrane protease YdiL (CAAX protease family)
MGAPLLAALKPFTRIIFSVLLIISSFIAISLIGILIAIPIFHIHFWDAGMLLQDYSNPQTVALLKYMQILQSVGLFLVPPLLAGFFFEGNPIGFLRMNRQVPFISYLFVILLLVVFTPFLDWMIAVNKQVQLPGFLSEVEQWMQDTEAEATRLTNAFLSGSSVTTLLVNLLMIAILPGIAEELMFRGLIQRLLDDWLKNIHLAIWISAFLFGAMHLQFYGLLPRMVLGAIFGYLFWWSGCIWIPVLGHLLNNAFTVVAAWLTELDYIDNTWQEFGTSAVWYLILSSALLTLIFMFSFYRIFSTRR